MFPIGSAAFSALSGFLSEVCGSIELISAIRYDTPWNKTGGPTRPNRTSSKGVSESPDSDSESEENYNQESLDELDEVERELREKRKEIEELEEKKEELYDAAPEAFKNELEEIYHEIEDLYDKTLASVEDEKKRQKVREQGEQALEEFIGDVMELL